MAYFEWIWPKIIKGLDKLAATCRRGFGDFDIGHAAILRAISDMDFRVNFYDEKDALYPDFDCFENRPNLEAWYKVALKRPSVTNHYNVDYEGMTRLSFCRKTFRKCSNCRKGMGPYD